MRIIFQNGEIAELTNVDKIVVYNPGEVEILKFAIGDYKRRDLEHQLGMEVNDEHPSSKTSGDGSISECNLAPESTQHAGQSSVCDISIESRETEAPDQGRDPFAPWPWGVPSN